MGYGEEGTISIEPDLYMGVGSPNFGVLISNQLPPEEDRGEPEKRVAGAMVRLLVSAGNLLKHTRCFF